MSETSSNAGIASNANAFKCMVDLFFFYAKVEQIMVRYCNFTSFTDAVASATVARQIIHPGTLVCLGLAR